MPPKMRKRRDGTGGWNCRNSWLEMFCWRHHQRPLKIRSYGPSRGQPQVVIFEVLVEVPSHPPPSSNERHAGAFMSMASSATQDLHSRCPHLHVMHRFLDVLSESVSVGRTCMCQRLLQVEQHRVPTATTTRPTCRITCSQQLRTKVALLDRVCACTGS